MSLHELLNIKKGITSVIGGGGKSTLIHELALELVRFGRVMVITTTHKYPYADIPFFESSDIISLRNMIDKNRLIETGTINDDGKLCRPSMDVKELLNISDFILNEADGSRGLPVKAHYYYEPVIPDHIGEVIGVVGADGFNKRIESVCHRPDRFCELTGAKPRDSITPEMIADVITKEAFCDKLFINKVESEESSVFAEKLGMILDIPVFAGSLFKGEWKCLH